MACKLLFSCILCFASFHKLRDLQNFAMILRDYGIAESAPRNLFAIIIAVVEFMLAVLLLVPDFSIWALQATALLFGAYGLALLSAYVSGKRLKDCGCGSRYQTNQKLPLWPIIRNCSLIAVIALALPFLETNTVYSFYDWLLIVPMAAVFLIGYWTIEELQSNRLLLVALQRSYE